MKKYNVYDLRVVKVVNGSSIRYLICKYNSFKDEYIELLTKERLKVKNQNDVDQLSDYYSILGGHCVGVPNSTLELNKKDILRKYIEINSSNEYNNELEKEESKKVVLKHAPEEGYEITPEERQILKSLRKLKKQNKKRIDDINVIEDITIGLTKEEHEKIYQDVVLSVLETEEKGKKGKSYTK